MTVGGRDEAERARRWKELQRSARAVRALPAGDDPDAEDGELTGRHRAVAVSLAAATGLGGAVLGLTVAAPLPVLASNGTLDSNLFALTNQDRTSNGVGALSWNSTLGDIADGRPFACSGGVANGRTVDMIQRDYFDHPIPECGGQYADIMLTPDGVQWTAWGENIAWFSDPGIGAGDPTDAAANMNTIYMNSAPHRANILNPSFNRMGVGSEFAASYQGSANAWLTTEEFIQGSGGSGGPAPTPRPVPVPVRTPRPVPPPVRVPAPVTIPQVQTAPPAPTPVPTPAPTPTPTPFGPASLAPQGSAAPSPQPATAPPAPLLYTPQGLLSDSVEAVLEGSLLD